MRYTATQDLSGSVYKMRILVLIDTRFYLRHSALHSARNPEHVNECNFIIISFNFHY